MLADFNYQTDQVQGYEQIYWGPNYNRLQQVGAALSQSTARSAAKLLLLLLLMFDRTQHSPPWLLLLLC
jgi:hypothetical protein